MGVLCPLHVCCYPMCHKQQRTANGPHRQATGMPTDRQAHSDIQTDSWVLVCPDRQGAQTGVSVVHTGGVVGVQLL